MTDEKQKPFNKIMVIHRNRYPKDDDDWYIRDLLCDIKHFCHKNKINFNNELDKADRFFVEEINEKF